MSITLDLSCEEWPKKNRLPAVSEKLQANIMQCFTCFTSEKTNVGA